jgi:hypothetical protein
MHPTISSGGTVARQPAIPTDPTAVDAAWMQDALLSAGVACDATVVEAVHRLAVLDPTALEVRPS